MPKVKSSTEIAAKWARVAPTRQQDYEGGVKDPEADWASNATASREAYEAGITESISRGAFQKGIEKAGNDKWRNKAIQIGAGRWGPGVRDAEADMAAGFEPFVSVIERTVLPPRGPRGDPRNMERATIMSRALSDARKR